MNAMITLSVGTGTPLTIPAYELRYQTNLRDFAICELIRARLSEGKAKMDAYSIVAKEVKVSARTARRAWERCGEEAMS